MANRHSQVGGLPPRYGFVLNPYPELRMWSCPFCEHKTGQRKIPLLIHVSPSHPIALNYTCRYCKDCDLLIAHKHEIEHLLTALFRQLAPEVIGNDYLIIGTVEKKTWREGMQEPNRPDQLSHLSDFATYHEELRFSRPGWYPREQEPPVWEPPASKEWIKRKTP